MFRSRRWNRDDWTPLDRVQRRVRQEHDAAMRTMPRRAPQFPPQRNYPRIPNAQLPPQRPAGRGMPTRLPAIQPQENNPRVPNGHVPPQRPAGRDNDIALRVAPTGYPRPHTNGNRPPLPSPFVPPPPWPNAHVPPRFVATTHADLIGKEAKILIYALHFFICLSWSDLSSTLNQHYAAAPERRPSDVPETVDGAFIMQEYIRLDDYTEHPFTIDMKCRTECLMDLKWRRLAANIYRAHRPENESDPLPLGWALEEDRRTLATYDLSQAVDMNEIRGNEFHQLCVALRTWIALNVEEIAQIFNEYWRAQPDRRPERWYILVERGWIDQDGLITSDGINDSLLQTRTAPYGSLLRRGYEQALTQVYWKRRAAVIYCQYPLPSYDPPMGISYMNGEIVGPDPIDTTGEHFRYWKMARERRRELE